MILIRSATELRRMFKPERSPHARQACWWVNAGKNGNENPHWAVYTPIQLNTIPVPGPLHVRISSRNPNMQRPRYGVGTAKVRSWCREYREAMRCAGWLQRPVAGCLREDDWRAYGRRCPIAIAIRHKRRQFLLTCQIFPKNFCAHPRRKSTRGKIFRAARKSLKSFF